jgi:signal transduction histidine kinase
MMRRIVRWASLAWLACAALGAVADEVELAGGKERVVLDGMMEHAEDASGKLDVAAMASSPALFRRIDPARLNIGYSAKVHWLRFSATNRAPVPLTRWMEVGNTRMQHVSVFEATPDGWQEVRAGTHVPLADKPVRATIAILPIMLPPGETRTWFIRIASETAIDLNATLWDPAAFRAHEAEDVALQALIFGALLLAGLSAVVTHRTVQTTAYQWFGLAQVFYAVNRAGANGIMQLYLWPEHVPFATWTTMVWMAAGMICYIFFVRSFLDSPRLLPQWDKLLLGLVFALALVTPATVFRFGTFAPVGVGLAFAGFMIAPVIAATAIAKGHSAARWLLASQVFICLLGIPYMLSIFGIATPPPAIETGLSLSFLLSSMLGWTAITNRFGELLRERKAADARAIARLEEAVQERTGELQAALIEAENANRAKTTFLAQVSHELRTPLHTVIGYAELLQRGSRRVTPREGGSAIEASARRLLALIDELLDFVRGESGTLKLNPKPVDWQSFLGTIVAEAEHLALAAGNRFIWGASGEYVTTVYLDDQRLRQVLDNLLVNANRHTSKGTVTLSVHTVLADDGQSVRIEFSVQDTGCGISPADAGRIFEPFVSGGRGIGGMGLGLSISRQLTSLMGGTLRLDRTSPEGSTFVLHIMCPLAPGERVAPDQGKSRIAGFRGPKRTALIVEDVEENRRLLKNLLLDADFDVITAASGDAVPELLTEGVDLVLTDQSMANGDGWDVLGTVRERSPDLPVILVSAAPPLRPGDVPSGLDFSAVLLKPVGCDALLDTVGKLLGLQAVWESTGGDAEAPAAFDRSRVAAGRFEELRRLIELGDVTGIEEWADELANEPGMEELAHRVKRAAEQLNFALLRQLAETERRS